MDQWTEATQLPALRAVAGSAVRVLPRPQDDEELVGIRVQVVGDDVLARRGILGALSDEPGMVVVGDHRPGPGVFATLAARHPDVVLLHGVDAHDAAPILTAIRRTGRVVCASPRRGSRCGRPTRSARSCRWPAARWRSATGCPTASATC